MFEVSSADGVSKLLLDAKANVNVLDKDGNSPLHRAVTHGGLGIEVCCCVLRALLSFP